MYIYTYIHTKQLIAKDCDAYWQLWWFAGQGLGGHEAGYGSGDINQRSKKAITEHIGVYGPAGAVKHSVHKPAHPPRHHIRWGVAPWAKW